MPVVGEHTHGDDDDAQSRRKQLGNSVREGLLEHRAVFHHGRGEVGKVALAEESEGQSAQFFRHSDAALRTLVVDGGVGAVVLSEGYEEHKHCQEQSHKHIEPQRVRLGGGLGVDVFHEEEEQIGGRQHQCEVHQCREGDAFPQVFRSFFGEGEPLLKIFYHCLVSFLFRFIVSMPPTFGIRSTSYNIMWLSP